MAVRSERKYRTDRQVKARHNHEAIVTGWGGRRLGSNIESVTGHSTRRQGVPDYQGT